MGFLNKLFSTLIPDRGRTPALLAQWLGMPESDLRSWLDGPPNPGYSYRRFTVPKRRGGERIIDAPSDDLKVLQKRIYNKLLRRLPAHPAVTGFVQGRSIVDNARPHSNQAVVINLDLADFFPSISAEQVWKAWRGIGWNKESARILTNICTCEKRLPQGAPTSPALSNLVCRKLDVRLTAYTQGKRINGHYTRYADDLTFSFEALGKNKRRRKKPEGAPERKQILAASRTVLRGIRGIVEDEGFRIQKKKRVRIQRAHQRQTATGLVVNRAVNLPREVRRRIRAMQHRMKHRKLQPGQQQELSGWEALQRMILTQRNKPEDSLPMP